MNAPDPDTEKRRHLNRLKTELLNCLQNDAFRGYPVQREAVWLAALLIDKPHLPAGELVTVIETAKALTRRLSSPKRV